jgi:FemAB-related protein (PEP-CTERM system-associated)
VVETPGAINVRAVDDRDVARWDAFVAKVPHASSYHQYLWRRVMERACGCRTHYLLAESPDGSVAGVLPLAQLQSRLFGNFLVSLPYFNYGGPLATGAAADAALIGRAERLAAELGASHMELRETSAREGRWPVRADKVAMLLPLASDPDAQFAAFGAKLRAQVRRPGREGATVERGGLELLDHFYAVFARNMRDLGTPVYGKAFFRTILEALGDGAELVVVSVQGRAAAAGLIVHYRGTTEIPWASSLREWNRIGVNMLLYWEVIQAAISRGSTCFDFGRSTIGAGTYQFKAQWGAKPRPLYWHYWLREGRSMPGLSPANPKFALAIEAWRRMPVWAANLVGPRIVRYLP